jgi:uncharacterized hydrophobic protein (TIGR00271 family)
MLRLIRKIFYKVEDELIEERHRASVIQMIKDSAKSDRAFWSLLILSAIIATLGLQAGNGAVIIGAMIIAPLIWPILVVSMAVVKGEARHFGTTIGLNFVSFAAAVAVSAVITLPFIGQEFNAEILLRSSPNVTDLFIALFSGTVAALSVSWPKITSSIAGVAVAASLMPPVSVIGIGLANGNFELAYGALLLFFTNIVAIFMASIIVFFVLGYRPHIFIKKDALVRMEERIIGAVVIFMLFLIPFSFFISQVYQENKLAVDSRAILRTAVNKHDDLATLKSFKGVVIGGSLHTTSEIFVPLNKPFSENDRDEFAQKIANTLNTPVVLDIFPIPVLSSVVTEEEVEVDSEEGLQ